MTDIDPRSPAPRRQRAATGLTALAVALLVCGAGVQATGNLLGHPEKGSGNVPRPAATTVQPHHTRSRAPETPSPERTLPTSPSPPPSPTPTGAAVKCPAPSSAAC
ncbi:hypothetical protein ACIRLA_32725 [Streptomyces sp. NPDC102364]|uniref:hypothetical protein n=1 Tax=Streptomyces sp. NPDC102364 TaxID=3366161 RepID=UPI00380E6D56